MGAHRCARVSAILISLLVWLVVDTGVGVSGPNPDRIADDGMDWTVYTP